MANGELEKRDMPETDVVHADKMYASMLSGEIDIQIATAKRCPRSIGEFKQHATSMACLDVETAEECRYAVPRSGKLIDGPSARFAEIVALAWKNLRRGTRVIGIDGERVTVQAVCHDLESNVATSLEVMRRITDKRGRRYSDDLIVLTANAASSIAMRNAVLRTIPKAYWKPVYDAAMHLLAKDNASKPLAEQRKNAFSHFEKLGVSSQRILAVIGKPRIDDVNFDDLGVLRGLATAIKEGDTTIEEAFPLPGEVSKSKDLPKIGDMVVEQPQPEPGDAPGGEPKETK